MHWSPPKRPRSFAGALILSLLAWAPAQARLDADPPVGWGSVGGAPGAGPLLTLRADEGDPPAVVQFYQIGPRSASSELVRLIQAQALLRPAPDGFAAKIYRWTSPGGRTVVYYASQDAEGPFLEAAVSLASSTYRMEGRQLQPRPFLAMVDTLREVPDDGGWGDEATIEVAATGVSTGSAEPTEIEMEVSGAGGLGGTKRVRTDCYDRGFSFYPVAGFEIVPSDDPSGVLALQAYEGDLRIDVLRKPSSVIPSPVFYLRLLDRLLPYLTPRSLLGGGRPRVEETRAQGVDWRWVRGDGPAGRWMLGGFQWSGMQYLYFARGSESSEDAVIGLLSSVEGAIPNGEMLESPIAPGPEPPDVKPPFLALLGGGALAAVGLLYLLFILPRRSPAPWASDYVLPDMLAVADPWTEHPLAGARVKVLPGVFHRKFKVVKNGQVNYRMVWNNPERAWGGSIGATSFLLSAGLLPPLSASLFGRWALPFAIGSTAALFAYAWAQDREPSLEIQNAQGERIGSLKRVRRRGWPAETYKVEGLDGSLFGYITRDGAATRLLRKRWHVFDYGGQLLLSAQESVPRSLVRRLTGRLLGLNGAKLELLEDEGRAGWLCSKGLLRRAEVTFEPKQTRTLTILDPLVLLGLSALLLVRDPDAHIPWPLA